MVWIGGGGFRLAPALLTLLSQLETAHPGKGWLDSPQTGTIGDAKHQAEASSDHNPWLNNTVRALDVAANVSGVPGIVTVTDAPDCEALFAMVNRMYGARDPRVYPNGYAIYQRRVTDWNNPGGFHQQVGDPHLYHLHISVSRDPAGYNSTDPWPLPSASAEIADSGGAVKLATPAAVSGGRMFRLLRNVKTGVVRLAAPGSWSSLEGPTPQRTLAIVEYFRRDPLCAGNRVDDVSDEAMQLIYNVYMKGHT